MTIKVTSTAFTHGAAIPKRYTGDGDDISPPLKWANVPEGTVELALICDDPKAPTPNPWVHWVVAKLPADCPGLPAAVKPGKAVEGVLGAIQGKNSWNTLGYRGPAPPKGHGPHEYWFTVYALSETITIGPEIDKDGLLRAMEGKILAEGALMGTYERK